MKSFAEISWFDYPKIYSKRIEDEILSKGKDYILKVDEEEYIAYLINKYAMEPLNIIHETEHIGEPDKSKVRRRNMWNEEYLCDAFTFKVTYNFTGTPELFQVQPDSFILTSYQISVNASASTVSFSFTIYRQDVAEFNKTKDEAYSAAFSNMGNLNRCMATTISGFDGTVRGMFQRIKNSYKEENSFFAAVKVKTNPNTASIFTAPTIKKKEVFQPKISANQEFASVPSMSQTMYDEVLKAIYDFGKNMEKKPSLYIGKDEEGLRDQFVLILETKYEGTTASGETFNRNGKTDISLKYAQDGSNLFVSECKFWHGASEFHKAISQLFDNYLTWRDSKVALMFFVKNQGLTAVLNTILEEAPKHPYFKKVVGKRGESSFTYIFCLPQDKEKEVQLEIMAFHYDKK